MEVSVEDELSYKFGIINSASPTECGYSGIKNVDVQTAVHDDVMQSFFLSGQFARFLRAVWRCKGKL